jgi:hypothetical protein
MDTHEVDRAKRDVFIEVLSEQASLKCLPESIDVVILNTPGDALQLDKTDSDGVTNDFRGALVMMVALALLFFDEK